MMTGSALDAICFGSFPPCAGTKLEALAAEITAEEWKIIHCKPDFLSVNVYNGSCIRADGDGEYYVPRYDGYPSTVLKWPVTERVMNEGLLLLFCNYT